VNYPFNHKILMYDSNGHQSRLAREHNQCCLPAGKVNKEPMKRAINCPDERRNAARLLLTLRLYLREYEVIMAHLLLLHEFLLQTSTELATSSLPLRRRKWKLFDTL